MATEPLDDATRRDLRRMDESHAIAREEGGIFGFRRASASQVQGTLLIVTVVDVESGDEGGSVARLDLNDMVWIVHADEFFDLVDGAGDLRVIEEAVPRESEEIFLVRGVAAKYGGIVGLFQVATNGEREDPFVYFPSLIRVRLEGDWFVLEAGDEVFQFRREHVRRHMSEIAALDEG